MKFLLVVCLVFSFTTKEQKTLLDLLLKTFFFFFYSGEQKAAKDTVLNKSNYAAFLWLSKTQSD